MKSEQRTANSTFDENAIYNLEKMRSEREQNLEIANFASSSKDIDKI